MAIELEVEVAAGRAACWAELEKLEDHVAWMADAVAINFHGAQQRGTGTAFSCATKIGPLRTTDEMVVTDWIAGEAMAVEHRGLFSGKGRFTLIEAAPGRTTVHWHEDIRFPWWALGPVGALLARPVLRAVWRGNLKRLKARIEA